MERDVAFYLSVEIINISTHTLTWSVTWCLFFCVWSIPHFTARRHGDGKKTRNVNNVMVRISTHTLTWSVTHCRIFANIQGYFNSHAHVERDPVPLKLEWRCYNFNSHAHVERDLTHHRPHKRQRTFQLTRSRGAWLFVLGGECYQYNFNSHAHVERDGWNTIMYPRNWTQNCQNIVTVV